MSYITEQEALANVTEFASQTASDKARLLAQSEAYLRARNVKEYKDGADVPQALKLACYEVIKGIIVGQLYQGKKATVTSKTISAQSGTSVSKTFADGSEDLNVYEQFIGELIAPFTKTQGAQWLDRI